jgi:hypothetical protein
MAAENVTTGPRKKYDDDHPCGYGIQVEQQQKLLDTKSNNKVLPQWQSPSSRTAATATTTPLKQATARKTKAPIAPEQLEGLQNLLQRHYQLLIQQAVLAIHTAYLQRNRSANNKEKAAECLLSGETGDDLIDILDSAVGMMQDLDQVSIRHFHFSSIFCFSFFFFISFLYISHSYLLL